MGIVNYWSFPTLNVPQNHKKNGWHINKNRNTKIETRRKIIPK